MHRNSNESLIEEAKAKLKESKEFLLKTELRARKRKLYHKCVTPSHSNPQFVHEKTMKNTFTNKKGTIVHGRPFRM